MSWNYTHPALQHEDSIRLLRLSTYDNSHRQLHGRLIDVRLSDRPRYCALSYVWGDGPFEDRVNLDEGNAYPITRNLFNGLEQLSLTVNTLPIWVDQICINQSCSREKVHQVRLMARVYSQAYQVIAWLRDPTNDTVIGLKFLRALGTIEDHGPDKEIPVGLWKEVYEELQVTTAGDLFNLSNAAWQGAFSLVQKPWFSRLWVVQEVVLSNELELRCGQHTISGQAFFSAIRIANTLVSFSPRPIMRAFQNPFRLSSLKMQLSSAQALCYPNLAHELSMWDCKDAKDRLNALFGLVFRNEQSPWFFPDYSLTENQLFERFALKHVTSTGTLDILHFSGDSRVMLHRNEEGCKVLSLSKSTYDIPSWVPDWRIRRRPLPLSSNREKAGSKCFSATVSMPYYQFHEQKLDVKGILVDLIGICGPPLVNDLLDGMDIDAIFNCWWELANSTDIEAKECYEMFASTLIMDGRMSSEPMESPQYLAAFEQWARRILVNFECSEQLREDAGNDVFHNPIQHGVDEAMQFGYHVSELCRYRSFFITTSGRFGLGPAQIAPGLSIYLIHGLKTPFVIQKALQSQDDLLRGECYVHGLMRGRVAQSKEDVYLTLV